MTGDSREGDYMDKNSITVSLCVIVKNEEQTISRCLESIKDVVE